MKKRELVVLIVQLALLRIALDLNHQFEMDLPDPSALEQTTREQESKKILDFYSHVTNPADEHSFVGHSLSTRHDVSCASRLNGIRTPCSCCAGAMTFQIAENLTDGIFQAQKEDGTGKKAASTFHDVHPSTMLGVMSIARMFGFRNNKAALNASFGTAEDGECSRHINVLWGTNGVIPRTLRYWRGGIVSMFCEIGRLRVDVGTWQQNTSEANRWAREEKLKRKAAEKRIKEVEEAAEKRIKEVQEAAEKRIKEVQVAAEKRTKEVEAEMRRAEEHLKTRDKARAWASRIHGAVAEHRAGAGGAARRLIRQKTPLNRPPARLTIGRGMPRASRSAAATDSGKLHRSTMARRRARNLVEIESIIEEAGPKHLNSAIAEFERQRRPKRELKADRTRAGSGWDHVEAKVDDRMHELHKLQGDEHKDIDEELEMSGVLREDALETLERAAEGDAPPDSLVRNDASLPGAEDLHFGYKDGTTVDLESGEMDGYETESEAGSCGSSMQGSESDSESETDIGSDYDLGGGDDGE